MIKRLSIILLMTLVSTQTYAACYHNGKSYNTGDVVGGYVCTASGAWIRK